MHSRGTDATPCGRDLLPSRSVAVAQLEGIEQAIEFHCLARQRVAGRRRLLCHRRILLSDAIDLAHRRVHFLQRFDLLLHPAGDVGDDAVDVGDLRDDPLE